MLDLTLFTTCKPFVGAEAIHQENAIRSWHEIGASVVLIGDEPGTQDISRRLSIRHIENVERNASGLPSVRHLFECAERAATTSHLAYLNSDIILAPEFVSSFETIKAWAANNPVFMTSRRKNIPLNVPVDFSRKSWAQQIAKLSSKHGSWDYPYAIDLFLFSRGLFGEIPDFSIGRPMWDNWMLWQAKTVGALMVDATAAFGMYHPIHGYGGNWQSNIHGDDAVKNRAMGPPEIATIESSCGFSFDGHSVEPLTDSAVEKRRKAFEPDTAQELTSFLAFTKDVMASEPDQLADSLRAMCWRWQMFFPLGKTSAVEPESLALAVSQAQALCSLNKHDTALETIQNALGAVWLQTVSRNMSNGRPVYIWGAGGYGHRVKKMAERNGLYISAFVDRNYREMNSSNSELEVLSPSRLCLADQEKPFILIGSMFYQDVIDQLVSMGFDEEDYCY